MERARRLLRNLGSPTVKTLIEVVRNNLIRNCKVSERDIRNMVLVYGDDVAALKGKATRQKPRPIEIDWAAIPKSIVAHHSELHLAIDLMFVNMEVFLTGIDGSIRDRHCGHIENRSGKHILSGLDKVLRSYNAGGFKINVISCDREFEPVIDEVMTRMGITMNYCSAGEHVPMAERHNRTVKERCRTCYATLPYNRMPRRVMIAMVEEMNQCMFEVCAS